MRHSALVIRVLRDGDQATVDEPQQLVHLQVGECGHAARHP